MNNISKYLKPLLLVFVLVQINSSFSYFQSKTYIEKVVKPNTSQSEFDQQIISKAGISPTQPSISISSPLQGSRYTEKVVSSDTNKLSQNLIFTTGRSPVQTNINFSAPSQNKTYIESAVKAGTYQFGGKPTSTMGRGPFYIPIQ